MGRTKIFRRFFEKKFLMEKFILELLKSTKSKPKSKKLKGW